MAKLSAKTSKSRRENPNKTQLNFPIYAKFHNHCESKFLSMQNSNQKYTNQTARAKKSPPFFHQKQKLSCESIGPER
ncbi:hypothetical protein CEXT_395101 [Caerostris extrusa]|uniref:Uncharacterized protein n=1 Tax=Caerostris extrusa TaxID=172846 RepID=A0AAV4P5W9_CAEEX|nr:hypothetical protein CEXT_395101 [Caerostris extrusa]